MQWGGFRLSVEQLWLGERSRAPSPSCFTDSGGGTSPSGDLRGGLRRTRPGRLSRAPGPCSDLLPGYA